MRPVNRLKQVRLSKGLNQKELAEALNLSQAAISGYETGKYDPGMKIWKMIADYFDVTVDYLIEDGDIKKENPTVFPWGSPDLTFFRRSAEWTPP